MLTGNDILRVLLGGIVGYFPETAEALEIETDGYIDDYFTDGNTAYLTMSNGQRFTVTIQEYK